MLVDFVAPKIEAWNLGDDQKQAVGNWKCWNRKSGARESETQKHITLTLSTSAAILQKEANPCPGQTHGKNMEKT